MQKHLAIGRGVKILEQKSEGGFNEHPPASLRVNVFIYLFIYLCIYVFICLFMYVCMYVCM